MEGPRLKVDVSAGKVYVAGRGGLGGKKRFDNPAPTVRPGTQNPATLSRRSRLR